MNKDAPSSDFFSRLWKSFTSIRLTVVLLLSLALTSIIGTVIPQNESPSVYFRTYGEFFYKLFDILDLFDMYHSWWFQFLLLLLTVNVIVCSLNRFQAIWKIVSIQLPSFDSSRFRKVQDRVEFSDVRSSDRLRNTFDSIISKRFKYRVVEPTEKGFYIFAEKGRWTRLGVYAVHLSVILLLCGGLIGSIFGFEGFVNIPEGASVDHIRLRNTGQLYHLGFEIRCDDFNVSFYDSHGRMPKEYRSSLTILEKGKPVVQKNIVVNDPLRFKGINIFQSSYGKLPPEERPLLKSPPEEFGVTFTSRETGMQYEKKATIGDPIDMPEKAGKLLIQEYRASAAFKGQPIGEAFIGILTPSDGEPFEVLLPLRFPNFDKMRGGSQVISIVIPRDDSSVTQAERYYTGLQVTKDPGVWIVYFGFIVMILGCFITFFMSHQQICIEVMQSGDKNRITVSGFSNKNKVGMKTRIRRISKNLASGGETTFHDEDKT